MAEKWRARLSGRRVRVALCTAWAVAVAALTAPAPIGGVGSWLDSSWQVGLDLSHRLGLPMGSRLFFPYGPYGYLTVNTPFFLKQWLEALVAGAAIHLVLVALLAVLLVRRRAGPVLWVVVTATLLIGLPAFAGPATDAQLVAILLAYLAVEMESPRWSSAAAGLCGATLALLLLMKVTAVPLVAGVFVLAVIALVARRRLPTVAALTASLAVVGAVLWFGAGLGIADIPHYLHAALEFGSGYSGAMYFMGLTAGIVVGAAVIVVLAALGIGLLVHRHGRQGLWILLAATALFPLFKDSFVRDGPVRDDIYFGIVAVLAALSLVVLAPPVSRWLSRRHAVPAAVLVAALLVGAGWRVTDLSGVTGATDRLSGYATALNDVVHSDARRALLAAPLRSAHDYYAPILSALAAIPATATIDVAPWDVGMIYEDGRLRWDPRPVLQSYQAYTSWLDNVDADFLRGTASIAPPDYIVYSYLTVDDRYAAFDEPAMFRALLDNYRVVKTIGTSAVLLQRAAGAHTPAETTVRTTCVAWGTPVQIPAATGVRMYAHLDASRSLPGRVLDLLAKGPEARITLATATGTSDHRLVTAVAGDGLYVSSLLTTTTDFASALAGSAGPPLTSLTVGGDQTGWSSRYCVTFTTTPIAGQAP